MLVTLFLIHFILLLLLFLLFLLVPFVFFPSTFSSGFNLSSDHHTQNERQTPPTKTESKENNDKKQNEGIVHIE